MAQVPHPRRDTDSRPHGVAPDPASSGITPACALLYDPLVLAQQARDALAYVATAQAREPALGLADLQCYADEIAGACRALGDLTTTLSNQVQHSHDVSEPALTLAAGALCALARELATTTRAARIYRERLDATAPASRHTAGGQPDEDVRVR